MLKEIDLAGALARIREGSDNVCILVPVTASTYAYELAQGVGFVVRDGAKEPEQKPKAEKPKPKPEKKNVDHGKIIALHNAGWTATAIASEVGCSIPTVTSHIKAEKEKGE